MKKLFLSAILSLVFYPVLYAQWTTGSNNAIYYNSGNVGIGPSLTAPVANFQVGYGPVSVSMGSANTANLNFGTGYLGFNASRGASSWFVFGNTVNNGGGMIYADVFGNIYMAPIASNGTGLQTLTDQDIKSRIAFQITPDGIVRTKQVRVELNGWPDYVFKKDYQLPSLSEVKAYINQNRHLPDVSSEQEIIKNGLNLGEMNKLLMKKVEELTLYMIERENKEKELQEQLDKLKEQVKSLAAKQ